MASKINSKRRQSLIESLESRRLLSAATSSDFLIQPTSALESPATNSTTIDFSAGSARVQPIAIADVYRAASTLSDSAAFDAKIDLGGSSLTVITNISSILSTQAISSNLDLATFMDTDWARLTTFSANILPIQSSSSNLSDLLGGANDSSALSTVSGNTESLSAQTNSFFIGTSSANTRFASDLLAPATSPIDAVIASAPGSTAALSVSSSQPASSAANITSQAATETLVANGTVSNAPSLAISANASSGTEIAQVAASIGIPTGAWMFAPQISLRAIPIERLEIAGPFQALDESWEERAASDISPWLSHVTFSSNPITSNIAIPDGALTESTLVSLPLMTSLWESAISNFSIGAVSTSNEITEAVSKTWANAALNATSSGPVNLFAAACIGGAFTAWWLTDAQRNAEKKPDPARALSRWISMEPLY